MSFNKFIIKYTALDDRFNYRRAFLPITGDFAAGAMLSQMFYWHLPPDDGSKPTKLSVRKDGYMWLVKSRDDWYEECGLTDQQARKALDRLRERGIIETRVYGFAGRPVTHIRIVEDRLEQLVAIYEELSAKMLAEGVSPRRMTTKSYAEYANRLVELNQSGEEGGTWLNPPTTLGENNQSLLVESTKSNTISTARSTTRITSQKVNQKGSRAVALGVLDETPDECEEGMSDGKGSAVEKRVVATVVPTDQTNGKSKSQDLPDADDTAATENTTRGLRARSDLTAKVNEVFEYWKEVNQATRRKLTDQRAQKIRTRLKTYTVEELKQAIDGAKANPWFNGNNSRGEVYNRLETIFRDDTTTDNHIEYAKQNPTAKLANRSMFAKDGSRGKIGMAEIEDRFSEDLNFKSFRI